jgi:CPA2 family monovalent cation:H+ antiporter-2
VQPLVGYLLAGVLVGPFTPGFIADQALAAELAEIGVILLMFGVGLHFSLKDLVSVARVAVPGALGRIAAATLMGMALAWALGWGAGAGLVFGLSLSVASTVVLVRALQERRMLDTERGRIAVGWVVVEDVAMILALVLLPAVAAATTTGGASAGQIALTLALILAKVAAFVVGDAGRRAAAHPVADALHGAHRLARAVPARVYAVALGVAFAAAKLFGASFALGAFFAGMVLGESRLSQRATEEAMPLRDAFAVLFFVSSGCSSTRRCWRKRRARCWRRSPSSWWASRRWRRGSSAPSAIRGAPPSRCRRASRRSASFPSSWRASACPSACCPRKGAT